MRPLAALLPPLLVFAALAAAQGFPAPAEETALPAVAGDGATLLVPLGDGATARLERTVVAGLPSPRVTALALDAEDGILFVGTDRGVSALPLSSGEVDAGFAPDDDDLKSGVRSLAYLSGGQEIKGVPGKVGSGVLVAGTAAQAHFIRLDRGGSPADLTVAVSADPRESAIDAVSPLPGVGGAFLLAAGGKVFGATNGGALWPVDAPELSHIVRARRLRLLGDSLYLCTDFGLFRTRDGRAFEPLSARERGLPPMKLDVAALPDGRLVASTPRGLVFDAAGEGRALVAPDLVGGPVVASPTLLAFAPLREAPGASPLEGLWAGTDGAGIALGVAKGFARLDRAGGALSGVRVSAILVVGDTVFVGSEGGLDRFRILAPRAAAEKPPAKRPPAAGKRADTPDSASLPAEIRRRFGVTVSGPWSADSLRAIYRTLEALPEPFRRANRSMIRRGDAGSLGGLGTLGGPGIIQIFDAAMRDDPTGIRVIVHEMAHNFQGNAALVERWKREISGPSCTAYGNTNPLEDMAESISYYYAKPALLKAKHPSRYDFIKKRVMVGKEFRGDEWL